LEKGSQLEAARTVNQCRHLLRDESMCWTFLQHPDIGLTNNAAERSPRPYVSWRKKSLASQSSQGDLFRPMVQSLVQTVLLRGANVARLLREICTQGMRDGEVAVRIPPTTPPLLPADS